METDTELVNRIRGGEDDAFRILVERHSRAVYRSAYRITANSSDADDVVQETFLRAYRALGSFDARAALTTWLHRIAVNCALDLIDARRRREGRIDSGEDLTLLASSDASPDRVVLGTEMQRAVARAMDALTGNERTAFVLRHFEGMPVPSPILPRRQSRDAIASCWSWSEITSTSPSACSSSSRISLPAMEPTSARNANAPKSS